MSASQKTAASPNPSNTGVTAEGAATAAYSPEARKRNLALLALASAIGCYVVWNILLSATAWYAERRLDSVPFRDQGWLRYLIPSYMARCDADTIFITGPSCARENLLVYKFEEIKPGAPVVIGACSAATLEDVILGLEYIERVYGEEHMPGTILLGVTSRAVGCFNNGKSPLQMVSFDKYSPYYRVQLQGGDVELEEKSLWASIQGRWGLLLKQPQRYKNAIVAVGARLLLGPPNSQELIEHIDKINRPRQIAAELGWRKTLRLWTQLYVLPYKYHHQPPRAQATLDRWLYNDDSSYWHRAREWDSAQDRDRVESLFQRFFGITQRHGSQVFVVNLPEHPQSLREYKGDRYDQYMDVLRGAIGDTPFLDAHDQFAGDQFHDFIHLKAPAAKKLSDRVREFMVANGASTSVGDSD